MIIVIDTNVLISAMIKDSLTRRIILGSGLNFCYPEISLHELRKYEKMIIGKSGLEKREFDDLLERMLEYIVLIPTEVIKEHLERAKSIMLKIYPKDVVFIATALAFDNSMIWSDDKDFNKQDTIKIIKTNQFAEWLEK
ncbi:MAG: PIN domain-containing protein [Candidatus Aenigmarchaeota archaeon]|nr:PIN domain-containing protein [Candidatus Aenigmarchaeota archaeon]